ncbi:hypothetical protein HDU76_009041 [Blyttiomyces sp. JEL0837]|nr:hypothetical protein HDU76_009041 [Blyttiomyces sp. JEL0837]
MTMDTSQTAWISRHRQDFAKIAEKGLTSVMDTCISNITWLHNYCEQIESGEGNFHAMICTPGRNLRTRPDHVGAPKTCERIIRPIGLNRANPDLPDEEIEGTIKKEADFIKDPRGKPAAVNFVETKQSNESHRDKHKPYLEGDDVEESPVKKRKTSKSEHRGAVPTKPMPAKQAEPVKRVESHPKLHFQDSDDMEIVETSESWGSILNRAGSVAEVN